MGSPKTAVNDESATESRGGDTTRTDSDSDDYNEDPPLESSPFSEGEKVLAYHSLHIYEAKVMKIEYRLKEWRYFVHYMGWSKNWDEWVGMDRLMKITEENLQKQQLVNKKLGSDKSAKPGRASLNKPKNPNAPRGKKRRNDFIAKEIGALPSEKLVNIQIPLTLKKQLIDDCEFIMHLGKLVKLPRVPSVDDILKKYLDYRLQKDGSIAESLREIMKGLHCYFDKALPMMLLYKSERRQYAETISDDISPSTVYGAEHLLRLFVKLPELLFFVNIEEETLIELQQHLNDFLRFMQKNQSHFFLSTYHVADDTETSTNKQTD